MPVLGLIVMGVVFVTGLILTVASLNERSDRTLGLGLGTVLMVSAIWLLIALARQRKSAITPATAAPDVSRAVATGNGKSSESADAKERSWYFATTDGNRLRQVVLTLPPSCARETRFSELMLFPHYRVTQKDWVAEVFTLDADPGPYLIVRADGITSKLHGQVTRIAFAFYHMKSSGILGILVNVDCPQATCREIGFPNIGFEMLAGLDTERGVVMYGKFIQRPTTHICFAESNVSTGQLVNVADGRVMTAFPQGKFDLVADVSPDCLGVIRREWMSLLAYHKTISRPDFQTAVNDVCALVPQAQEKCPILPPANDRRS